MLKQTATLLLLVSLAQCQYDYSEQNGQRSPDKQCDPKAVGGCTGFTKLSPIHNIDTLPSNRYKTQYHKAASPDIFKDVKDKTISVKKLEIADPWNVGRLTLSEKKIVKMPADFPFGTVKGIQLQTIRLVVGSERIHRMSKDGQEEEELEVVLVGRNLDQDNKYMSDANIAFSRVFRKASDGDDPVDAEVNSAFADMMDLTRVDSTTLDLTKLFPQGERIDTYEGGNAEQCSCDDDTTWVLLSSAKDPDSFLKGNVWDRLKNNGFSEVAWRKYNEKESSEIVVTKHRFEEACNHVSEGDCKGDCVCPDDGNNDNDGEDENNDGEDGENNDGEDGEDNDDQEDGDGQGDQEEDECKKEPIPAHCMSSASASEVCMALTLTAAALFF